MNRFLTLLLALVLPLSGGGSIDFDGTGDAYDCGPINLNSTPTDDDISIMAWVTPNFASSDTGGGVIVSQTRELTCPLDLPPQCTGVTCAEGYGLEWDGANSRFSGWATDDILCNTAKKNFCFVSPTFSAGDLIGLYFSFKPNVQECEAVVPGGTGATGSKTNPQNYIPPGVDTWIGYGPPADTGKAYWRGTIDMLILGDGRVVNKDSNMLQQTHKRSWHPMWSGTFALNGSGGSSPFSPHAIYDMMEENEGDTVSTIYGRAGPSCSSTGDPTSARTLMMY